MSLQNIFRKLRRERTVVYGGSAAIHSSMHVDVETDEQGRVLAVWFRCMQLPFEQKTAQPDRQLELKQAPSALPRIISIEVAP
jgi:hypothetical protein